MTTAINTQALILVLSLVIVIALFAFYKELVYISFDEQAAQVGGIPVRLLNDLFILLSAATIATAIPIIGILLISALLVLPVVIALQFKKSFKVTLLLAEAVSVGSVLVGIVLSFYLNLSTGGVIVLLMLLVFGGVLLFRSRWLTKLTHPRSA